MYCYRGRGAEWVQQFLTTTIFRGEKDRLLYTDLVMLSLVKVFVNLLSRMNEVNDSFVLYRQNEVVFFVPMI